MSLAFPVARPWSGLALNSPNSQTRTMWIASTKPILNERGELQPVASTSSFASFNVYCVCAGDYSADRFMRYLLRSIPARIKSVRSNAPASLTMGFIYNHIIGSTIVDTSRTPNNAHRQTKSRAHISQLPICVTQRKALLERRFGWQMSAHARHLLQIS
jgi:hypothetical protein